MAWSNSRIFRQYLADMIGNTAAFDYDADTIKVALYGSTITPDNDVTAANSRYNVGQWATAGEIFHTGQWAQGGVALASKTVSVAVADQITVDAADTSSGSAATLTAVHGCLVYDDTLTSPAADQGMSYHYFGGALSSTLGTFTVVWNASGLHRYTTT